MKIPAVIVDLSAAPFCSSLYFTYFAALLFGAYTFKIAMSSYGFILCHRVMAIPVAGHFLCLKFI